MTELEKILDDKFPDDLCDLLVNAISKSYAANIAIHDSNLGHDNMSFGLLIYKSNRHHLLDLADKDERIKIAQNGSKFVANINGVLLSPYRVGDAFDLIPDESFPKNRVGAFAFVAQNHAQLKLFETRPEAEIWTDDRLPAVILAHTGNYENGLSNVFLGVPSEYDDLKQITKWEAHKVLKQFPMGRAARATGNATSLSIDNLTPSENITRPKLIIVTPPKAKEQ